MVLVCGAVELSVVVSVVCEALLAVELPVVVLPVVGSGVEVFSVVQTVAKQELPVVVLPVWSGVKVSSIVQTVVVLLSVGHVTLIVTIVRLPKHS
jgi:hypothetical protein